MTPDRAQADSRPEVLLFTDGACIGNPGPGGWAFVLKMPHRNVSKELSGGEADTTNNRMEMLAVIRGVEALRRPCRIRLCSDSKYVVDGLTHCMSKWKALGWKKKRTAGRLIKNADLWQRLDEV